MKKNKMMRVASILLVAVMLSTCAISGTFAKYVTSAEADDSARVAKWGVTVTADAEGTFAKEYATDTADYAAATVISTEKVVAPGTSGVLANVAVEGTPEVAVRVSYAATLDLGDNWVADGVYYCPIVITVNGTNYYGMDYDNATAFEAAVNTAINGFTQNFAANAAIKYAADTSITWSWAYEADSVSTKNTDAKDTILGNAANAAKISLDMTVTATQIN